MKIIPVTRKIIACNSERTCKGRRETYLSQFAFVRCLCKMTLLFAYYIKILFITQITNKSTNSKPTWEKGNTKTECRVPMTE